MRNKRFAVAFGAAIFTAGFFAGHAFQPQSVVRAQSSRVFEIRRYTAPEGKLSDLHARFRNHTLRIFQKHGMENIVYFSPQDAPLKDNTLIYIIAHASREQAKKNWAEFAADPEWQKVAAESQVNGRLTTNIESIFVDPTDYSPMK
jgi:hypothetical protein